MRLWGVHGQALLLSSRICLLGASATGTETLKNLVLPGCGHVTIVDAALVTQADLSNNFFVSAEYLGRPRAEVRVCAAGLPRRAGGRQAAPAPAPLAEPSLGGAVCACPEATRAHPPSPSFAPLPPPPTITPCRLR